MHVLFDFSPEGLPVQFCSLSLSLICMQASPISKALKCGDTHKRGEENVTSVFLPLQNNRQKLQRELWPYGSGEKCVCVRMKVSLLFRQVIV